MILEEVDTIRLITFKSQALRQPELTQTALPLFAKVETQLKTLVAETTQEINIRELNTIAKAAEDYKGIVPISTSRAGLDLR